MLESAGVQCIAQEPIVMHHSIPDCDFENDDSLNFSSLFSPIREKKLQENKNITPFNKRKCLDKTGSPPKRHKQADKQKASIEQNPSSPEVQTTSPKNGSNFDVHPGGGLSTSVINERLKNTFIIFDWDDTFFPSSYLALLEVDFDTNIIPKCLNDRISVLESHLLDMLNFVISKVGESRVCIITNAEKGWITLSGQKFMPRLLQRVHQCKIVSARSTFEPFAPASGPFEWKLLAFHMAAEVLFGVRFPKPVVHVMRPRQIVVSDCKRPAEDTFRGEVSFDDVPSDTLSKEVGRLREVVIDNPGDSGGTADTDEKCIVQFSEDCLKFGGDEVRSQKMSLSNSAAGFHRFCGNNNLESTVGRDLISSTSMKTETVYMPCSELVGFPDVPTDYLKLSGLDFVQTDDAEKVLRTQKYIVSLGDSLAEKIATLHVANAIPTTTTKTLKYMDRPNIDQLVTQTILVRNNIQQYLEMAQALDIVINVPDQDMSSFEQQFWKQKQRT